MRKIGLGFNVRLVSAPGTARWIDRFGPHLSTLLGVELTVECLLDRFARRGLLSPDPAEARLLATAFEALRDCADLLVGLPPIPDHDAHAELTAALAEMQEAVASFMHPSRRLDCVREALSRADAHLLQLGTRVPPPPQTCSVVGEAST
jgi:hypothetical protein